MELTNEQMQVIKRTWGIFRRMDPQLVGDVFYSKLFMQYPGVRHMFPKNMEEQYVKLLDMLTLIVARLENIDKLTDEIIALAKRHVDYGVKEEHYVAIGDALLWTLQQGLGKDWSYKEAEAWTTCYGMLSNAMIVASGYK